MRYLLHREIYNTELSRVSLPTMTVTFSGARILEQVMDVSLNLDQNKANCESANKKTCGGTELS